MKKVLIFLTLLLLAGVIFCAGCTSSVETTIPSNGPVVENTAAAASASHESAAGDAQSFNDLFGDSDFAKSKGTTSGGADVETSAAGAYSHKSSAGDAQSFNDLFGNFDIAKPKTNTYELTEEEYANLSEEEKAKITIIQ
ncbi:MAG TPA: hypothetical protein O0X39_06310 [Methanocorpusculum sp.]|nr:hypothetical protein [Methanocorpusculum sp.]